MLDNIGTIFNEMQPMMKSLKKASYERNMEQFRVKHGHYFEEMMLFMEAASDKETAAGEIAGLFTAAAEDKLILRGRIRQRTQADANFFMIYYVFPALLLTGNQYAKAAADSICTAWGKKFRNSRIGYTDYDSIYGAFREKIMGIF